MREPIRLTAVLTHPIQYYTPWFRHIHEQCPEIDLTVLYATQPLPHQQGVGFGQSFEWDIPLTDGYECRIVRPARPDDNVHSSVFRGIDVPEMGAAIRETRPDVVLVPGWNSITFVRALKACRKMGIPVLYRGDTHLGNAPQGWKRFAWKVRTRRRLHQFHAFLCVGSRAREYLSAFGIANERIFDAPHFVDNAFFAKFLFNGTAEEARRIARSRFGLGDDEFVVLYAGKLDEIKRPIDAVRAVSEMNASATLLVVGAGREESRCREEATRSGLRAVWAGFMNQSEIGTAYAAADCLLFPSESETWGLTVNEALAAGIPCVVSDRVGCAPDLIDSGMTGETFPMGNTKAAASALDRVREMDRGGHLWRSACQQHVARFSIETATEGILQACRAVVRRNDSILHSNGGRPIRVIACCGGMSIVGGLERLTMEVLRTLRERGAAVHCIVNSWANWDRPDEKHPIVRMAEEIGATTSTGSYWYTLDRHTRNPVKTVQMLWDIAKTSLGLLRDSARFRPTHLLLPEFMTALRNAPALVLLRMFGCQVYLRVGDTPDTGRFYRVLWRRILPWLVTRIVANSQFARQRLLEIGVPGQKLAVIRNAVAKRAMTPETDQDVVDLARQRRTILCVGQVAPFKGTHFLIDAIIELLRLGYDVQAVIVGRKPDWPAKHVEYFARLEQKVRDANLSDRILFVGERRNILDIMRASYLLAAPIPEEECFGNVVLEAKSVGLPAVAFARGGLVELIEHRRTGYLCEGTTLPALLVGLRYFLDAPAIREAASAECLSALARPDADHTPEEFSRRWWELFQDTRCA